ncbi:Fe-Mn family superoxide dismutase [Paenibacillus macerans]|uniref:Fe-Mn family superoxide dismutase n=1 Tax=Paenibacillus macerans TaxID=44252 RepID=UPI003D316C54
MLFVYGPYLPVRILEEIRFWKQQEAEHTEVIQAIVPELEPNYVQLLEEWKPVFAGTEAAADKLLQYGLSSKAAAGSPQLIRQTERLLQASFQQSREFVRQLHLMLERSAAVKAVPLAPVVLMHIIRESEYFLAVLERLNRPGEIAGSAAGTPPYYDPYHPVPVPSRDAESAGSEEPGEPRRPDADPRMTAPEATTVADALSSQASQPDEASGEDALFEENAARREPADNAQAAGAGAAIPDRPVPIGGHTLPPLPYPYNALEPYIDEKTMRIHHDKHHKTYVDDLNKAEKKLQEARKSGNFDLVKHWERELAFNGAGHYLHTIFWETMNPHGGGNPEGELLEQIKRDFGSYDAFHKQFSEAANKVEGGGWAILVWSPRSHRLEILTAEKHQNLSQWDVVPLLPLDVWEHAYYLKHQNVRADYIKDWWNVVYWPAVAKRYEAARKLKWQPY